MKPQRPNIKRYRMIYAVLTAYIGEGIAFGVHDPGLSLVALFCVATSWWYIESSERWYGRSVLDPEKGRS